MKRAKNFRTRLEEPRAEDGQSRGKLPGTNAAMVSLLPHHPKSLALANEDKGIPDKHDQLIDRFRSDLLEAMRGQNRLMKHELCNALKLLENIIRVIDVSHVYDRLLMAINIFKYVKGSISDLEREQAKTRLFPSPDKYVEETTKLIAEVVSEIRSLVGMKQLHEAIAASWNSVTADPEKLAKPSDIVSNVVKSTLSALEMPSTSWLEEEGEFQLITMEQDQTETKHLKRLREKFRLFQRAKRQKEKAKKRSEEESRESRESKVPTPIAPVHSQLSRRVSSPSDKRQSRSPAQARSPSKEPRKSPSKKTPDAEESATTVDEDETADETASARKRRLIRKKYGIQLKDDDFIHREAKEEIEEFENVAVALRPAATKMRKAKLRWKTASPVKKDIEEETLESPPDVTGSGWEESMSVPSDSFGESDFTETTHDEDKNLNEKYAKRYAELKANPKENVEQLLRELHALFLRVNELEQLEKTYLEQIQELKKQLAVKDEKISELSRKSEEAAAASAPAIPATTEKKILVQKTAEKDISMPEKIEKETQLAKTDEKEKVVAAVVEKEKPRKTSAEGEKMTAKLEAVAKRGLDILRRNQLLEQTLNDNEAGILASFFESDDPIPDKRVVDLIDKALSYGVEVLLTRPDLFEDFVDNELRLFLIDANKAKRILLDCMLLHPEYVPTKWGGTIMRKRQREGPLGKTTQKAEEKSNQNRTKEKGEEKSKVAEEALRKGAEKSKPTEASTVQAALQTTRSIFDYLVEASKWAASASTTTVPSTSFSKEKSTAGEKTIERKTLPKSDSSKSEGKTESEKKNEKEMKAQPKPSESKSEEEARIKQQASFETVKKSAKEQKVGIGGHGKGWKYRKSGSKSPPNASWVHDRKRYLRNANLKQRPKKKN